MAFPGYCVSRMMVLASRFRQWLKSPTGRAVLKCTIAYTLASLATFVTPLSHFLGKPAGKHVVATITVYFHPARSVGSMIEAVMIGIFAIAYAEMIGLLSMVTSAFFGSTLHQVKLAHALVVLLFIGGGFGFMGWVKQKMENPLVNVAITLASLAIISIVTKENHVVSNVFSNQKIVQVGKILIMGVASTTAVNLLIWRVSARSLLRKSLIDASASLGDKFSIISRGFLLGSEDELILKQLTAASEAYNRVHPLMVRNLREAKFEHYVLGRAKLYVVERSVVASVETLDQSVRGLRSAASTLHTLLEQSKKDSRLTSLLSDDNRVPRPHSQLLERNSAPGGQTHQSRSPQSPGSLPAIEGEGRFSSSSATLQPGEELHLAPNLFDVFTSFMKRPMMNLTERITNIFRGPYYGSAPDFHIANTDEHRHGLIEVLNDFNVARYEALQELYEHTSVSKTEKRQADSEQISAACGHFLSSVQSLAEEAQKYLDLVDDLKHVSEFGSRNWRWVAWWRGSTSDGLHRESLEEEDGLVKPLRKHATPRGIPDLMIERRDTYGWRAAPGAAQRVSATSRLVLKLLRVLARDDIRFGLKVGIGAAIWATFAFLERTRETYNHLRGEWGLLSFMIVCSMTVGASNTTGYSRFLGTLFGAAFSLINWNLSQGNALALVVLGWFVSFWSFYWLVAAGKAPLGRMTLLAYNVSTLYAYSMSKNLDDDDAGDEGGEQPNMLEIAKHRVIIVTAGIIWGLIICRVIWPISARKKFKEGFSVLCLQMGLIWRRGPLAILLRSDCSRSYLKSGEQAALQRYVSKLESLRQSAQSEFQLRGPFPFEAAGRILRVINRILDGFSAMSLVTQRSGRLTEGERALLQFTAQERAILCDRVCHIFQVIASSMMLEYPLTDAAPDVVALRNGLLARVFEFRKLHSPYMDDDIGRLGRFESKGSSSRETVAAIIAKDGLTQLKVEERDYALLYAYALVTGQVAEELDKLEKEMEGLYGILKDDAMLLQ